MATVGFDTATDDTAVAVCDGDALHESLLGLSATGSPMHSTALLAEVERGVAETVGWDEVTMIAVGVGPGSFTGLRVGIATARALGLSRGLPVVGACTLDAIGRALGEREESSAPALAALDARRGEVFAALYAPDGERLWDPLVSTPEGLTTRIGELPESPRAAGSGAVRFRQELARLGVAIPEDADPVHRISARHICALAKVREGGERAGSPVPIYLRPPDAERWRERDTFQTAR
ncbi:MAG TPA: tRNA (adenosine(37)-N6)-threonylcarbamoyltransferase complex dimerization subunit type 1 TsaB [Solirubrobacterales bacterium]